MENTRRPVCHFLTPEQERTIRDALSRGATDGEAYRAAGVGMKRFYEARRIGQLADLPRGKRGPKPGRIYTRGREFVDLPLDVIYRRAFEIRSMRPPDPVPGDDHHRGPAGEERAAMRAASAWRETIAAKAPQPRPGQASGNPRILGSASATRW